MTRPSRDFYFWAFIMVCAGSALVLGAIGWWDYGISVEKKSPSLSVYLEIAYRTVAMFLADTPDLTEPVRSDDIELHLARILAPVATFGTLIRIVVDLLYRNFNFLIIRLMRRPTVICGLTRNGMAFARTEKAAGRNVVVVDEELDDMEERLSRTYGFRVLPGDPMDPGVLVDAGIRKATRVIIATEDDGRNLEIATRAREIVEGKRPKDEPLLANVLVADRQLWRRLSRSEAIERKSESFEMLPFNLSVWAARHFVWQEPLYSYADLREQDRIHVVLIGYDDFAEALVEIIPSAFIYRDFGLPAVTVLARDSESAKGRLYQAMPKIKCAADVCFVEFDPAKDSLEQSTDKIEKRAPVSAIFVCGISDRASIDTAIYVQEVARVTGRLSAPVYVRLARSAGLRNLLVESRRARRFCETIQPFGIEDELCDVNVIEGDLEHIAQQIHKSYERTRMERMDDDPSAQRIVSLSTWRNLSETYRMSNRRAADHIKAKLASAGCRIPSGHELAASSDFRLCEDDALLEALSDLEHRSWMAGRFIDGWRLGKQRDNVRRLHDKLVHYTELDEATKEYDRDQVRLLDEGLIMRTPQAGDLSGGDLVARDHWVGLVGKNDLSGTEAEWLERELAERILPALLARHKDAFLTLLSPLAPGSDLVMTRATLDLLRKQKVGHRLLVVEAVPEQNMIDDFRANYEAGAAWNGSTSGNRPPWRATGTETDSAREAILNARRKIIQLPITDWALDLTSYGNDYANPEARRAGYRAAADYINRRCHTLIAAHRPGESGETPRPGGIAETLRNRGVLTARDSGSGSWPEIFRLSTIVMDLANRRTEEREHPFS